MGCVTQNDDDAGDATLIIACLTVCLSLVVSALHQDSTRRLTRPFEALARSFGAFRSIHILRHTLYTVSDTHSAILQNDIALSCNTDI